MKDEYLRRIFSIIVLLFSIYFWGSKFITPKVMETTAEINSGIIQLDDEAINRDVKKYCWKYNGNKIFGIGVMGISIGVSVWAMFNAKKFDDKGEKSNIVFGTMIIVCSLVLGANLIGLIGNPKSDNWKIRVDTISYKDVHYKTKGRSEYNVHFQKHAFQMIDAESYNNLNVKEKVYLVIDKETNYILKIYPFENTNYLGKKLK